MWKDVDKDCPAWLQYPHGLIDPLLGPSQVITRLQIVMRGTIAVVLCQIEWWIRENAIYTFRADKRHDGHTVRPVKDTIRCRKGREKNLLVTHTCRPSANTNSFKSQMWSVSPASIAGSHSQRAVDADKVVPCKVRATAAFRFSSFLLNPRHNLVMRRRNVRMLRLLRSTGRADHLRFRISRDDFWDGSDALTTVQFEISKFRI